MSPHLSPDAKAIVRAAEAMTAEVRRIANALEKPAIDPEDEWTGSLIPPILAQAIRAEEAKAAATTTGPLRDQIAQALYGHDHSGWSMRLVDSDIRDAYVARADAVLAVILPTTKLLGDLHRSAHEDLQRVIDLYERWAKTGAPIALSRIDYLKWWREHLDELHAAIHPPEQDEDPT